MLQPTHQPPDGSMGQTCVLQFQKLLPEGKERRPRGKNSRNTSREAEGPLPELQQPGLMPPHRWKFMFKLQKSHSSGNTMTKDRAGKGRQV